MNNESVKEFSVLAPQGTLGARALPRRRGQVFNFPYDGGTHNSVVSQILYQNSTQLLNTKKDFPTSSSFQASARISNYWVLMFILKLLSAAIFLTFNTVNADCSNLEHAGEKCPEGKVCKGGNCMTQEQADLYDAHSGGRGSGFMGRWMNI